MKRGFVATSYTINQGFIHKINVLVLAGIQACKQQTVLRPGRLVRTVAIRDAFPDYCQREFHLLAIIIVNRAIYSTDNKNSGPAQQFYPRFAVIS